MFPVGLRIFSSFPRNSFKECVSCRNNNIVRTVLTSTFRHRTNQRQIHLSKSRFKAARIVVISTSDVIFDSLALEEWLYEHRDLSSKEYLFMWKNKPAIVSGRHQNPWLEANIPLAASLGLDIARRSSGGGTVYHDEGNLNLSFLKSRDNYNRRENLDLVVEAVTNKWDIDLTINDRDDILLNKLYKVSGTAAKLGRLQSYHHFTLLHSVDLDLLQRCLTSPMQGASSKATKSFPATVMNLSEQEPDITFDSLTSTIGEHFLAEVGLEATPDTFRYLNPLCETEFPGVTDIARRLQTWEWRFAKSPDFSIERNFTGHTYKSLPYSVQVKLAVRKGALTSLEVRVDNPELEQLDQLINQFCRDHSGFLLMHENVKTFEDKFLYCFSESSNKQIEYVSEARRILKCILSSLDFL
ncbi:hypothetical protein EGW08_000605 [Elysia chlorotica]|uniref:BPL/LPL catalytic domain-containing protein n=1 Tax=Elysia chlorotica TaxID=188477 RepID=A0A433UD01_ELYCH|nr:hypothetical protein EGW08_000605 [Elysia chlorotica]